MTPTPLVNNQLRIATICSKGSWGSLVRQACFRAGFQNFTQIYDGVEKLTGQLEYDVVFIDENIKDNTSGGELLDSLFIEQKLSHQSAVIMVCDDSEDVFHNYDNGLQIVDFLAKPFSEKDIISKLLRVIKVISRMQPTLAFIESGRLSFAYKALNAIPQDKISKDIFQDFCRLNVNLSFELGKFEKVLAICQNKRFKEQKWTMWPTFKANYELGNWEYCQNSVNQEPFISLPSGPNKLFWQLRVLLEQQNFDQAIELINAYPSHEMPTSLVRLIFTILTFAERWEEAEQFIERKIRLASTNPKLNGALTTALCNVYLFEYYTASNDNHGTHVFNLLKKRLAAFRDHKSSFWYKQDIAVIDIFMLIIANHDRKDESTIEMLKSQLQRLEFENTSWVIHTRIAYAWFLLGETERAFKSLIQSDIGFSVLPLSAERLILALNHKKVFNAIFPQQSRSNVYRKLGDAHLKGQRYKLACKAYVRALETGSDNESEIRKRLSRAMTNAGIKQFAGFKINQDLTLE